LKVKRFPLNLKRIPAGRTDTLTKKAYITVLPKLKPPKVDFSARPNVVKISKTVQFTDKSKNNPTSWTWDFGDGATSILQNPSYAYNSAGKYTVTLTVKNSAGSDVKKVKNCVTVTRK
jgi:PKD repeat protein